MQYSYDDFILDKWGNGLYCGVGRFGDDIYAVKIYVAESTSHGYYECRLISKEEYEAYPENVDELYNKKKYLCSDYMGKEHDSYSFTLSEHVLVNKID